MLLEANAIDNKFNKFVVTQRISEQAASILERKINGVFFTNDADIIDHVLECLPCDNSLFSMRILEPSCGEGIFLLKLIFKAYLIEPNKSLLSDFISQNIFFADVDLDMVQKSERNILEFYNYLFGEKFKGRLNSFCLDFTLKHKISLFPGPNELYKHYGEFDFILGNPPYITLYGRRDKKKNEEQRIYYLKNYNQFPSSLKNGKINYVMLFIEHGIDFLKEGGELSFIIDVSFFETAYTFCRKYLIEHTRIKKIIYNIQGFENVASGQLIITFRKEKVKSNKTLVVDFEEKREQLVEQFDWHNEDDEYKFRINNCKKTKFVMDKILAKEDPTLKDLYPRKNLRTCVMLLDMEEKFTTNESSDDNGVKFYPYYQGSKGLKYKYSRPKHNKYFIYDKKLQDGINDQLKIELTKKGIKNKKRIGLGEIEIYDNPKVFIRQSAKELIATYDEKPSSANNSLYVFSLRNNDNNSIIFLKYLCGLLNSKLYTFFAQQQRIIRYNKGKQPQIKTSDLYQIKVPRSVDLRTNIVKLVNRIYEQPSQVDGIKNEIDCLIYKYYGLSEDDINIINNSIQSYLK